jgi:hypothetical protein
LSQAGTNFVPSWDTSTAINHREFFCATLFFYGAPVAQLAQMELCATIEKSLRVKAWRNGLSPVVRHSAFPLAHLWRTPTLLPALRTFRVMARSGGHCIAGGTLPVLSWR